MIRKRRLGKSTQSYIIIIIIVNAATTLTHASSLPQPGAELSLPAPSLTVHMTLCGGGSKITPVLHWPALHCHMLGRGECMYIACGMEVNLGGREGAVVGLVMPPPLQNP